MMPRSLKSEEVHRIRTEGLADAYWEKTLCVSRAAVQKARVGITWKEHPTPPDTRPRVGRNQASDHPRAPLSESYISRALSRWPRVSP
jgi:hypothetical protein